MSISETKTPSTLDLAFFMLKSRERMSNVGPLAILQPPAGTRGAARFADRLLAQVRKRPVGTPCNRRYVPPGVNGMPRLEAVADVDLDLHCHRVTLAAPGTDEQLSEAVCRLHEKRLDRSRPPWEFCVINGFERGRIALYAKVHHGIIDGRGFVEVCTRWFRPDPADRAVRALWEGMPVRRSTGAASDRRVSVAAHAGKATQVARSTVSMYAALARQALASPKLGTGLPPPFLGTSKALHARPSVHRSFAYYVLPLARMKAFGKAHEASMNDVLLTVLDMALHRNLLEEGGDTSAAPLAWISVRRAKALSFSGCESRPATVAPAGSNRSNRGGNEAIEAFGVEGPLRDLAIMQAVM